MLTIKINMAVDLLDARFNFDAAKLRSLKGVVVEWEVTFIPYQKSPYYISFGLNHFNRVLQRYRQQYAAAIKYLHFSTLRKEESSGKIFRRREYYSDSDDYVGQIEHVAKTYGGARFVDNSHGLIARIAFEQPLSKNYPVDYSQTTRRDAKRWRLSLGDDFFLDITYDMDDKKYYYELETINVDNITLTPSKIRQTFLLIYGGTDIFTIDDWFELQEAQQQVFGDIFPHRLLANARNLQKQDLTYYGLLGNIFTHYRVTHKADGERVLLIHYKNTLWEQQIPYTASRLVDINPPRDKDSFPLSVFETEKIFNGLDNIYLVYDTLAINGRSVLTNNHFDRLAVFANWVEQRNWHDDVNKLAAAGIKINQKEFRDLGDVDSFYSTMQKMTKDIQTGKIAYPTDGFIFMPAETPYPSGNPSVHVSLHSNPAICKWKPAEKITIDFILQDGNLYYQSSGKKLILFEGTNRYKYSPLILPNTEGLQGAIVEVAFVDRKAKIERIRLDKFSPNHPDVIFDNWRMINEPIDLPTLLGKNLMLLRAYHNNIKRILLESYQGILLDLGSGRGGDLAKWREYQRIVAVEPSAENIRELIARFFAQHPRENIALITDDPIAKTYQSRQVNIFAPESKLPEKLPRLTIIHGGAENVTLIKRVSGQEKFSVISSMLSLSLIQLNDDVLQMISDLLAPRGVFVYFSIDREGMFSVLRPGEILRGDWGYFQREDLQARLDFVDTIVTEQLETPPDTHQLDMRLQKHGLRTIKKYRADGERFLSADERLLTSMYVYGEISK